MSFRFLRYGAAGTFGSVVLGGLLFGSDLLSYMTTSAGSVRESVRDSVPIEFELERARNLIDEIVPEIHSNVRLIAEDEVEIAALKEDIKDTEQGLHEQRQQLASLRDKLETDATEFDISGRTISREHLTEQVSRRFDRLKDSEMILAGKRRLLETRHDSLSAAMQMLDRARDRKAQLGQKIEALIAQNRMLKSAEIGTTGTRTHISDTNLSKADQLLSDIQKRLDVAERVLEHESSPALILQTPVNESDLLTEIDKHLGDEADSIELADSAGK
jgi:hypothetical protein